MIRFLSSTKLAVALCLILAAGGIAGSLLYQGNTAFGKQGSFNVFRSPVFLVPAGLLVLNILFCAGKRLGSMPFSSPRTWTFAGMHAGIVLLAAGMILDGLFGSVGTRYYYQGVPDSSYTNWRTNRTESFPFTVEVLRTETRYHPLNLRIGVKDAEGNRVGLYTIREGVPFEAGGSGIRIIPLRFDVGTGTLFMEATIRGQVRSGISATAGKAADVGGMSVSPVEYADPEPSEYIARVRFQPAGVDSVEKEIGVNRPATFAGISFCLVGLEKDKYGNPYAGLQMTREPGEPVFWAGSLLFCLSLLGRFFARRSPAATGPSESEAGERATDPVSGVTAGLLVVFLLGALPAKSFAFGTVIEGERTWEGEVRVTEPVTVKKGATLRIRPGTPVLLSGEDRDGDGCRDGSLQVFGTLLVEGEKGRPVRFSRLDPGIAWEEIFLKDAAAVIRYAIFEGGNWGLHVHDGDVKVEHTVFRDNGGGARLRGTGAVFSRTTFRGNGIGLRFWDGGPEVSSSVVEGNGIGLFYREGTGGGKIRGNRISNREWNVKIGDWATGELDVSGNFWGDGAADAAAFRVGDFREKKEPGRIVLAPALSSPPEPCGADIEEVR